MRNFSILIGFAALLGACTIDARPEADGTPPWCTYVAPPAATEVQVCENFSRAGEWRCTQPVAGRAVDWTDDLDVVRMCKTVDEGGYVVDFPFNTAPYHRVSLDGNGGFTDPVGELECGGGTVAFQLTPVADGLGGARLWVEGLDCGD